MANRLHVLYLLVILPPAAKLRTGQGQGRGQPKVIKPCREQAYSENVRNIHMDGVSARKGYHNLTNLHG